MTLMLTPVVELEPWGYSRQERPSPSGSLAEDPQGWFSYWAQSLADSGIVDLTPWPAGTFLVPVDRLTSQVLATVIRCALLDVGPDAESDEIPMLPGGYVLTGDFDEVLAPGCCTDFNNLDDWAEAVSHADPEWSMLWTGHPWRAIRARAGVLELSETTEEDGPGATLAVAATVERTDLEQAVIAATSERERFAARLADAFTTGPDPVRTPGSVTVEETVAGLLGNHLASQ